jgi:uncharacterized membrane protein
MNKKVTKIIILIVLFIILTGLARYLILIKKPTLEKVRSYNLKFNRDSIEYLSLDLSGDGKYGYIVFQNIKDKKYYIQLNNQTYGPYDDASSPQFSNDSSKYGWWFKKDNKEYIQINDQTYGPYDKTNFTFTKDNKVYIIYVKDNKMIIEQID